MESVPIVQHGSDDLNPLPNSDKSDRHPANPYPIHSVLISFFSQWKDRLTMDTLRPLPVFLGITGPAFCFAPQAFTPPTIHLDKNTKEKVQQRIKLNFAYFLTNYALIASGTSVVITLMHPIMIMFIGIMFLLWKTHDVIVQHDIPMEVMGLNLGEHLSVANRTRILYTVTAAVVIVFCLIPLLMAVTISGLIIVSHAVMRDPKQVESGNSFKRGVFDSDEDTDSGSEVMVEKSDVA